MTANMGIFLNRDFITNVQQQFLAVVGGESHDYHPSSDRLLLHIYLMNHSITDDALSDDAVDAYPNPITLPPPDLEHLPDIEQVVRSASVTQGGRDALSKFVLREDYIKKLVPLVSIAEDLESLSDLHRLCTIMKSFILLNDNTIIEHVVTDPLILGVVGALECKSHRISFPQPKLGSNPNTMTPC
jgi:hypothetical protein